MATRETVAWVDVAKGLGIVAVVFGHVVPGAVADVLYIFHMPLFFAISGYLFRPRTDPRQFLQDRALHLLVPYGCFLLLLFVPTALPRAFHGEGVSALMPALVGGRWLAGPTTPFWFITCLFLVQVLMNPLLRRFTPGQVGGWMGLSLLAAWAHARWWPGLWLPWNADVVLMAGPFFLAGHLLRRHEVRLAVGWPVSWVVAALAVALQWQSGLNTFDMKHARYGLPVITFVSALALIHLTVLATRWMARVPGPVMPLIRLGQASMMIMFLHQPVQLVLQRWPLTAAPATRMVGALLLPWLAWEVVRRHALGRAFLLGSAHDMRALSWRRALSTAR